MPGAHKMIKHMLKILQHFLQIFYRVIDHFVNTSHKKKLILHCQSFKRSRSHIF